MLPRRPPAVVRDDFDPSQPLDDEDTDMQSEPDQPKHQIHAVEINILIYLYLLESNFTHSAFTLMAESQLKDTSLFKHFNPTWPSVKPTSGKGPANGGSKNSPATSTFGEPNGRRIERGELVRHLWNAVRWEEIERHCADNGEIKKCPNPFHLLIPHTCPPTLSSASKNPPEPFPTIRMSPPSENNIEAFPPPPETQNGDEEEENQPAAGPSRIKLDKPGKRGFRRDSEGSSSRTRSVTPVARRRKIDEDEPMPEESRDDSGKEDAKASTTTSSLARRKKHAQSLTLAKDKQNEREKEKEREKEREREREEEKAREKEREKERAQERETEKEKQRENERAKQKEKEKEKEEKEKEKQKEREVSISTPKPSKDHLSVPMSTSRSKSPAKNKDKTDEILEIARVKGKDNPKWFQQGDIGIFPEHRDAVTCVAWNSKNQNLLASASIDSTAKFLEFKPSSPVAGTGSRGLALASKPTLLSHKSIEGNRKAIHSVSWHPDGTLLATAAGDGVSRMFTPNGALEGILAYGRQGVNVIKFSPNGSMLLTATDEPAVNLFSVSEDPPLRRSYDCHSSAVNDVDWLDDYVFASGGNDKKMHICRADDRLPHFTYKEHYKDDVVLVRWSPRHTKFVLDKENSGAGSDYGTNLSTRTVLARERGKFLAAAADDGMMVVWRIEGYPQRTGTQSAAPSKSPSPPHRHASNDEEEQVKQDEEMEEEVVVEEKNFNLGKHEKERAFAPKVIMEKLVVDKSKDRRMVALEWSQDYLDDRVLIAAGGQDCTIKIYDVITSEHIHDLAGLEDGTGALAWSPAGFRNDWGLIAGGGWSPVFRIWDAKTGEVVREYELDEDPKFRTRDRPYFTSVAWRPDGEHIAVGTFHKSVITFYVGDLRTPPVIHSD